MNKIKTMTITYVVLITLIIIFPPVRSATTYGFANKGFSAIWICHKYLSINIPFLLIELFAITAICAVIYFFAMKEKYKKEPINGISN